MERVRRVFFTLVVAATLGLLAVVGAPAVAQDATQTPTPAQGPAAPPPETHPAAIHQGTCSQPTPEPAYEAGDVGPFTNDEGQPIPQEEFQGTLTAPPVLTSTETGIEASLDDLLAQEQPHVLIVHQSAEAFETYIACGELGGPVQDDQLVLALRPMNNSGYAGTATLRRDGDNTQSNIYLYEQVLALSGGQAVPTPTPPPSPTPGPTAAPTQSPTPVPPETPTPPPAPTATPPVVVEVTATPPPA